MILFAGRGVRVAKRETSGGQTCIQSRKKRPEFFWRFRYWSAWECFQPLGFRHKVFGDKTRRTGIGIATAATETGTGTGITIVIMIVTRVAGMVVSGVDAMAGTARVVMETTVTITSIS